MYAALVIVPTVMAYVLRHHEYLNSIQRQQQQQQTAWSSTSMSAAAAAAAAEQPSLTLLNTTLDLAYSLALEYIWTEPVSETAAYYLCPAENGPLVHYLGTDYMPTWSWCPKPPEEPHVLLMSPDARLTDLNVVVLLSFTLALIRIFIVRIVLGSTNFQDSTRMHALIKCKSTHLLSRDYHLTPCGTPVVAKNKPLRQIDPREFATAVAAAATAAAVAASTTTTSATMQRSNFSLLSRPASATTTGLAPPNIEDDDDDDDDVSDYHDPVDVDDDDNALDDNNDYVNVGLLWDHTDASDAPNSILAPRQQQQQQQQRQDTNTASFMFPPAPPVLSHGGSSIVQPPQREQQQQQQHGLPDSPLEYLTDASIRRCNSTSSGLGGQRSKSSQRLLSQPSMMMMAATGGARIGASSSCTLKSLSPSSTTTTTIRVVPNSSTHHRPERLYAAPRLATAVFRLAYTTVSVVLAWHSFYTADFWPWYVGGGITMFGSGRGGGGGSTRHVWDLNGGAVSVGVLDSDFDLRNTVLRRYFLVQASYHFHSTAFHVLSMIVFLIQNFRSNKNKKMENNNNQESSSSWVMAATAVSPSSSANPQSPSTTSLSSLANNASSTAPSSSPSYSMNGIWKVSTTSYLRSLLHHALALLTLGTAYIFSSLRRLVAIGMFAFDVSSWFLHLLQICVNAKNDNNKNEDDNSDNKKDKDGSPSWWQNLLTASRIQCFHLCFVLPSFVYCRFYVWGLLWHSALTESHAWLQQLEKTLFPNAALILQSLWNVCMAGLFVANLIHLHRLWHHPHLKRICLRENSK
jgi:TLC domain